MQVLVLFPNVYYALQGVIDQERLLFLCDEDEDLFVDKHLNKCITSCRVYIKKQAIWIS